MPLLSRCASFLASPFLICFLVCNICLSRWRKIINNEIRARVVIKVLAQFCFDSHNFDSVFKFYDFSRGYKLRFARNVRANWFVICALTLNRCYRWWTILPFIRAKVLHIQSRVCRNQKLLHNGKQIFTPIYFKTCDRTIYNRRILLFYFPKCLKYYITTNALVSYRNLLIACRDLVSICDQLKILHKVKENIKLWNF